MQLTAFAAWLNSAFGGYDRFFLRLMHTLAGALGGVLTPVMKVITLLGEKGLILILISLVLMLFSRTRRTGICMFGAIACGAILTNFILKDMVARPRPFESLTVYRQWWEAIGAPAEDGFSFPSGHMTAAVAGLTALCMTRGRKWILPSLIWVLLMAVSRNYLMAHFPSDVLFGALVGLVAALIAYAITLLIFHLLESHEDKRFCAALLGFDLPLRLPLRRRDTEEEAEEEDEDEAQAQPSDTGKSRTPAPFTLDSDRLDISATFDAIMDERRSGRSAATDVEPTPVVSATAAGEDAGDEEDEAAEKPRGAFRFSLPHFGKAADAEEEDAAEEEEGSEKTHGGFRFSLPRFGKAADAEDEEAAEEEEGSEKPRGGFRFSLPRFGKAADAETEAEGAEGEKTERESLRISLPRRSSGGSGYQGKHVK